MVQSLLYVGRTKGRRGCNELDLSPAVSECTKRFLPLGITGALICADSYLAHVIEGTPEAVEKVQLDCHPACAETGARLVLDERLDRPRFDSWTLVYAGDVAYIAERIRDLVESDGMMDEVRQEKAKDLIQIMVLFAGG